MDARSTERDVNRDERKIEETVGKKEDYTLPQTQTYVAN